MRCELCDSEIKDMQEYLRKKETLIGEQRYKEIIDILINSSRLYDQVFFMHAELPSPYKIIG